MNDRRAGRPFLEMISIIFRTFHSSLRK